MIFRLEYCNDSNDTARVDIETQSGVGVQEIEGSGNPFQLQYRTDKSDKRGRFMTSSANINIFENPLFNIDTLKTSNETDIKVSYYVNEVLTWQGFVIPDFFSKEVKQNAIVSMVASDRVSTLKAVTLSGLDEMVRIREVAELCLAKTGLTLPLLTLADFKDEDDNLLFNTYIQSQRLGDEKGRSISCYDILESILTLSNGQLVQRKGSWQIVNKYQLEQGSGKNYSTLSAFDNWSKTVQNFTFIKKGARRIITPVASSVGVFHEYGGGKRYPDNYDFGEAGGWTAKNGFNFQRDNREVKGFTKTGTEYDPIFGEATEKYALKNNNNLLLPTPTDISGHPYLESTKIYVPFTQPSAEINIELNATAAETLKLENRPISVNFAVIAESTTETLILNNSGKFVPISNNKDNFQRVFFGMKEIFTSFDGEALTRNAPVKGLLEVSTLVSDYKISIRIYGSGLETTTFINYISYTFKSVQEIAKGTLYKTTQGTNFTKEHEIETSIFGDYLTKGLNGYFYDYQNDDTSSLIAQGGAKTASWTAPNEVESLPLLQLISRQKARQFSIAHDIIRGDIEIKDFDPLAIFKDCNNKEYTVISADFDFLRGIASVEIEQILYNNSIDRRDYIYSYFGEGENSVKSVGGISGGGGSSSSGGGITSEQLTILTNLSTWWKLDDDGNLFSEKNVYSTQELSAYGFGSGSGGGTGGASKLSELSDVLLTTPAFDNVLVFDGTKWINKPKSYIGGSVSLVQTDWNVTDVSNDAFLKNKPTKLSDFNDDIGVATHISNTTAHITSGERSAWNNKVDKVSGKSLILDSEILRLSTVTNQDLSSYAKSADVSLALNTKVDKVSGKSLISDTEITRLAGITNQDLSSYATTANLTAHTGNSDIHITSTERSNWNASLALAHSHFNKTYLDTIDQSLGSTNQVSFGQVNAPYLNSDTFAQFQNGNYYGNLEVEGNQTIGGYLYAFSDFLLSSISTPDKSIKNFINKFNDMFELSDGAIKAKYNLYSIGEISAYATTSSGLSSLKLMGDFNANNFNINSVNKITAGQVETSSLSGLSSLTVSGITTANEFKFGTYSFKQDSSSRLGIFRNSSQIAYIDTLGNYVKI